MTPLVFETGSLVTIGRLMGDMPVLTDTVLELTVEDFQMVGLGFKWSLKSAESCLDIFLTCFKSGDSVVFSWISKRLNEKY